MTFVAQPLSDKADANQLIRLALTAKSKKPVREALRTLACTHGTRLSKTALF